MTADVASEVSQALAAGRRAAVGRVIDLKGFSTLPVDELIAFEAGGRQHGDLLGDPGRQVLRPAADEVLEHGGLRRLTVSIHGPQVAELGLSCGGQAEVLLQPAGDIPTEVWAALERRAPVALVTVIEGPGAGPAALGVDGLGRRFGQLDPSVSPKAVDELTGEAAAALAGGRTGRKRVDSEAGHVLIEAWVPTPRLVVVGSGDAAIAIEAQAGLLGWETRTEGSGAGVEELLDWAGATAALVVLSHDPHVDVPALRAGLGRDIAYIGAMGSRSTQSRRLTRLEQAGFGPDQLDRIHRPIGLDLGGRRAPEVALSIVAEILAVRHGRSGGYLKKTAGPIHN